MENKSILRMKNISKQFIGVRALDHVNFELFQEEIHILCGENGAGKSTLMKILAGNIQPTEGEIYLYDKKVEIGSPSISEQLGISMVYQELNLSPAITVAENIFLGREYKRALVFIDKNKMHAEATRLLKTLNCDVYPGTLLKRLDIATQQLVQIAKAISLNAKILIMDEPFSALGEEESNNLFKVMENLRQKGVSIVYIDHRVDNFFKIGGRITVLRDGAIVGTVNVKGTSKEEIIKMMVGRSINNVYPKYNKVADETVLDVADVSSQKVKNINFSVRRGEIFGISGLVGAGRTEILKAVFGLDRKYSGTVKIKGIQRNLRAPLDAIKYGTGYVPEDRKSGLILKKSVRFNSSIVSIDDFKKFGFIIEKKEKLKIMELIKILGIKTPSTETNVINLSGGNQQKIILAKWLMMRNLDVLLMDEPTRGIDVGVKYEIYKLINDLANKGIAIVLITSELPELIGLCDRIAVVKNGSITKIIDRSEMTQEKIISYGV